jgi:hypothetical protein
LRSNDRCGAEWRRERQGWLRGDVLVRARIEASGETEGAAANMASRVMIDGSGGHQL